MQWTIAANGKIADKDPQKPPSIPIENRKKYTKVLKPAKETDIEIAGPTRINLLCTDYSK